MNDLQKNNSEEHRNNFVIIILNDVEREIHRGSQSVSVIKTIGEIPLNHMLEQLIEGKLVPLNDNGSVTIKGGEIFIGHVKDGASA